MSEPHASDVPGDWYAAGSPLVREGERRARRNSTNASPAMDTGPSRLLDRLAERGATSGVIEPVVCPAPALRCASAVAQAPPDSLGLDPTAVESIWAAGERLYGSGIHPAIQVCVRFRGAVILDRAIGWAQGGGPDDPAAAPKRPCTPDTPFVLFSASKAVTAMLVHLLDERNRVWCTGSTALAAPGTTGARTELSGTRATRATRGRRGGRKPAGRKARR
jgi:hypothetical protein